MSRRALVGLVAPLLLAAGGSGCEGTRREQAADPPNPMEIDVLVLNFDPTIPARGDRPAHAAFGWNDPRELATQYRDAVEEVSHGRVRYRIVEWRDVDAFPTKTDGFVYSPAGFERCWEERETCHQPDGTDYPRLLEEYGVVPLIEADSIDELWIFGAPYMGFWESAMAGPGAFYINGGVYDSVAVAEPFAIMGFSYERALAEMLHNLCHRTEATMTHISGGWAVDSLTTPWARFAANTHQSGTAAVGTCHFPPNGEDHYDYDNPRTVASAAADWLDYPDLDRHYAPVNRETWGGPLYHENYMKWWFRHLPHVPGTTDGFLNDWWRYVFELEHGTT